jgi:hypothetical protein
MLKGRGGRKGGKWTGFQEKKKKKKPAGHSIDIS